MKSRLRLRLLPGAVLLVLGVVAIAISSRVLSTFLLEVVAQTIRSDTTRALEPFDYSWGTMHWGQVSSHYSILCVGLFLIAIGQFLVLPAAVGSSAWFVALLGSESSGIRLSSFLLFGAEFPDLPRLHLGHDSDVM